MTLTDKELDAIAERADWPNDDRLQINLPDATQDIRVLLATVREYRSVVEQLRKHTVKLQALLSSSPFR